MKSFLMFYVLVLSFVNHITCGVVSEGEWKDGNKNGDGKQKLADGKEYDGDWKEDGKAKYIQVNG